MCTKKEDDNLLIEGGRLAGYTEDELQSVWDNLEKRKKVADLLVNPSVSSDTTAYDFASNYANNMKAVKLNGGKERPKPDEEEVELDLRGYAGQGVTRVKRTGDPNAGDEIIPSTNIEEEPVELAWGNRIQRIPRGR